MNYLRHYYHALVYKLRFVVINTQLFFFSEETFKWKRNWVHTSSINFFADLSYNAEKFVVWF